MLAPRNEIYLHNRDKMQGWLNGLKIFTQNDKKSFLIGFLDIIIFKSFITHLRYLLHTTGFW